METEIRCCQQLLNDAIGGSEAVSCELRSHPKTKYFTSQNANILVISLHNCIVLENEMKRRVTWRRLMSRWQRRPVPPTTRTMMRARWRRSHGSSSRESRPGELITSSTQLPAHSQANHFHRLCSKVICSCVCDSSLN